MAAVSEFEVGGLALALRADSPLGFKLASNLTSASSTKVLTVNISDSMISEHITIIDQALRHQNINSCKQVILGQ
jgi:hypothetical protein